MPTGFARPESVRHATTRRGTSRGQTTTRLFIRPERNFAFMETSDAVPPTPTPTSPLLSPQTLGQRRLFLRPDRKRPRTSFSLTFSPLEPAEEPVPHETTGIAGGSPLAPQSSAAPFVRGGAREIQTIMESVEELEIDEVRSLSPVHPHYSCTLADAGPLRRPCAPSQSPCARS